MATISDTQAFLRPEFIQLIRSSKSLKHQLMVHFNISNSTLQLWLDRNNKNFTHYDCLLILQLHSGIKQIDNLLSINQISKAYDDLTVK